MTPKNKAIELYEKLYFIIPSHLANNKQHLTAKGCALICVDEILEYIKDDTITSKQDIRYWSMVSEEIIKI